MIGLPAASFSRSAWVAENFTSRPAASNSPSSMPTITGRSNTWLLGAMLMTGLKSVMGVLSIWYRDLVSRRTSPPLIPAHAGIQAWARLGPRLRGDERNTQLIVVTSSKPLKQPAATENLVLYPVGAEGVPDRRDVDRDNRFPQLLFQRREDVLSREVG